MSYLPQSLASILIRFRTCFTRPTFETFSALLVGWLLCRGKHRISSVLQALHRVTDTGHHARFYRFLSRSRWRGGPDALGRIVFGLLLQWLPATIEAAVDDTLCRRGGPQIFGAGMHHDAAASSYGGKLGRHRQFAFGHDWVVVSVRVPLPWATGRGLAVPVLARLYRPPKRCPGKTYRKRTELARDMLALLASWLPEGRTLSLVGDSEYACRTVVRALPTAVVFAGPLVMDAALHEPPPAYRGRGRPPKVGLRLPSPRLLSRRPSSRWTPVQVTLYGRTVTLLVQTLVCLWPTVAAGRLVRVVVTRDPKGRYKDRAYFATDPDLSVAEILVRIAHRWELEVTFRDLKQLLGLEDPQNGWWRRPAGSRASGRRPGPAPQRRRARAAVERTVPFVLVVHAVLVVWYLHHGSPRSDVARALSCAPWYRHKRCPSLADMVTALRAQILQAALSEHPLPERVRRKVLSLLVPAFGEAA